MSGLYNLLFGYNQACILLAPMLTDENPQSFFPRFRDCHIGEDNESIEIFTRVGGGNREDYDDAIETLRAMPTYVEDYDDDFDCTYATFVFGVPDEWRKDFDTIKASRFCDLEGSLSKAYVERMQTCYPKLDIREILSTWANGIKEEQE